jgi:hypothetical protein
MSSAALCTKQSTAAYEHTATPAVGEKTKVGEVLWKIFKRFSPILDVFTSNDDKENSVHFSAVLFSDFLLDNIDLVHKLEDGLKNRELGTPMS